MGSCYSRMEREEMVGRCKARKRYMKQLLRARQALSTSHSMYLTSLSSTGSALLQFSNNVDITAFQFKHQHNQHPPPMSSSEEETVDGSEPAVVVSEIFKKLDDHFSKAADAGSDVSSVLEAGKVQHCHSGFGSLSDSKLNAFAKCGDEEAVLDSSGGVMLGVSSSHSSTLQRLYALERKLFSQVKTAEMTNRAHEKKVTLLKKLEMKRGECPKIANTKNDIECLESRLQVAAQAIEATSLIIVMLRETELYPQLIELVKRSMSMWRNMYECHQVQTHIVKQLKYLSMIPSTEPTSEIHRRSTLQLELKVQQWQMSFSNLVKTKRDYIGSLTGWLRLSLFQFNRNPLTSTLDSKMYSLCEVWQLVVDRMPDKVASYGINSFLTVIHAIVVQQSEEQKQKKRSESALKELEKSSNALRTLESKYGQFTMPEICENKCQVKISDMRAKVDILRAKAEDEKTKHEKLVCETRSVTLNNLQMGLPNVFEAITGFTGICMDAFESVNNQAKSVGEEHNMKMVLP